MTLQQGTRTIELSLSRLAEPLASQFRFLIEADRLKSVLRGSRIADGSRRENTAEHSWHIALFAVVLAAHAAERVDPLRVITMLLLRQPRKPPSRDGLLPSIDHACGAVAMVSVPPNGRVNRTSSNSSFHCAAGTSAIPMMPARSAHLHPVHREP